MYGLWECLFIVIIDAAKVKLFFSRSIAFFDVPNSVLLLILRKIMHKSPFMIKAFLWSRARFPTFSPELKFPKTMQQILAILKQQIFAQNY